MDQTTILLIVGFSFSTIFTLVVGYLRRRFYYIPVYGDRKNMDRLFGWGITLMMLFILLTLFFSML